MGVLDVFVSFDSCTVMMSALSSCASWVSSVSLFLIPFMFTWEYYESFVFVCRCGLSLACFWFGFCFVLCGVLFGGKVGFVCCVEV